MSGETIEIVLPVALKEVFDTIGPAFTTATGHSFNVALMLNPEVPGYIASGAQWAIAVSNPQYVQKIVADGHCHGGVRELGYSPLSFAMRGSSDAKPLQSSTEIAEFLSQSERIAITEGGTSGAQFARLADRLGIAERVEGKLSSLPGGGPMAALRNGEVDVAGLPLSNIAPVPDVFAKAICPLELGVQIDLAFCLHENANGATRQFANWLLDPGLDDTLRELGVYRGSSHR